MGIWLDVARIAATLNIVLLLSLGFVWIQNYRSHGATHTLGLLVFDVLLLLQNALWLYFYVIHPGYVGWYTNATLDVQLGMTLLCGLEFVALIFLARITWL